MAVVIFADDALKNELLTIPFADDAEITWLEKGATAPATADAVIDLLAHDNASLSGLKINTPLYIVNAVEHTCEHFTLPVVRINGWRSFLGRTSVEAATKIAGLQEPAEQLFHSLGRTIEWVPDIPGFITARVVACILNEAFFTLEEKIATAEDINQAMKTGTNYPYGPFEWASVIGHEKVYHLLSLLAKEEPRYTPSLLLNQKALA